MVQTTRLARCWQDVRVADSFRARPLLNGIEEAVMRTSAAWVALAALAIASVTTAVASAGILPPPAITGFAVTPSSLSSAGGEVAIKAQMPPGLATCTVSVTPSYGGLPSPFACGSAPIGRYVVVPPNSGSTVKTYSYVLTASYSDGTVLHSKPASLSEGVSPRQRMWRLVTPSVRGRATPQSPPTLGWIAPDTAPLSRTAAIGQPWGIPC